MRVLVLLPFGLNLLRLVTLAAGPGVGFGEARFEVAVVQPSSSGACVKGFCVVV